MLAQELNVVELYCGCGGLSFIDRQNEEVHIETKWAVDMEPSMCAAFQANYPKAKVTRSASLPCSLSHLGLKTYWPPTGRSKPISVSR